MTPILSFIVQSFIQHFHNLNEIISTHTYPLLQFCNRISGEKYALVISHLRDLIHLLACRPPWVVGCGIANFRLHIRVTFRVVLCCP